MYSSSESRPSGPRHTLFLPMLILLFGSGTLALYQVMYMEDQLDQLTQAVDKMDGKVKRAQYEKAKFYGMVRDVLSLAPKDPNADKVVVYFKLRELQAAQPELLTPNSSWDMPTTNGASAQPAATTNTAPVTPAPSTNASSAQAPVSTGT